MNIIDYKIDAHQNENGKCPFTIVYTFKSRWSEEKETSTIRCYREFETKNAALNTAESDIKKIQNQEPYSPKPELKYDFVYSEARQTRGLDPVRKKDFSF